MWATDGTGRDIVRATMSLAGFSFLLCCLGFDDESTRAQRRKVNKLAPIADIFEKFLTNSKDCYIPGEFLTVIEMLLPFRGSCQFRMFMPNKPAKYGIKIPILTDCKTHYMLNAEVYTGKALAMERKNPKDMKLSYPTEVVLRLVEPFKNTARNITGNNWYSSLELVRELRKHNMTYIRCNSKKK